jgi:hypothetical protein
MGEITFSVRHLLELVPGPPSGAWAEPHLDKDRTLSSSSGTIDFEGLSYDDILLVNTLDIDSCLIS